MLKVTALHSVGVDGLTWKLECDPNHHRGRVADSHFDGGSSEQFSGAIVEYGEQRVKTVVKVLGIILVQSQIDGKVECSYRFIISRMVLPPLVPRSYLPYDIVVHKKDTRRGIDVGFIADDRLLEPIIFIPDVDGPVGFGQPESKDILLEGERYFYMVDPSRFSFPKPVAFDISFYSTMSCDDETQRPLQSMPVFLTHGQLKLWQNDLGLEVASSAVEGEDEVAATDVDIAPWFDM